MPNHFDKIIKEIMDSVYMSLSKITFLNFYQFLFKITLLGQDYSICFIFNLINQMKISQLIYLSNIPLLHLISQSIPHRTNNLHRGHSPELYCFCKVQDRNR